jgi:hypothetical protein
MTAVSVIARSKATQQSRVRVALTPVRNWREIASSLRSLQ